MATVTVILIGHTVTHEKLYSCFINSEVFFSCFHFPFIRKCQGINMKYAYPTMEINKVTSGEMLSKISCYLEISLFFFLLLNKSTPEITLNSRWLNTLHAHWCLFQDLFVDHLSYQIDQTFKISTKSPELLSGISTSSWGDSGSISKLLFIFQDRNTAVPIKNRDIQS